MKNIETSIVINASVEKVWNILTNFQEYPEWNPFIISIKGQPVKGGTLTSTIKMSNQKTQTFRPIITELKDQEEFRWVGKLFVKGLFDGEHYFKVSSVDEGKTKLIHGENFSGLLVGPILKAVKEDTVKGFHQMNAALKSMAEKTSL